MASPHSPIHGDSIAGQSPDLGVVIVSHNPAGRLVDLCRNLGRDVPVLIVDNASASEEVLEQCAALGAEILRLPSNEGVSGALARGHAHFRGRREWILTFDQDSIIGPDFVTGVWGSRDRSDARVAILGPTVIDADSGRPLQARNGDEDARFVITSGALCRVAALDEVGGFREDLFIDHVDHDVCLRLRRRGWRLRIVDDVVMEHSIGAMRDHRVLGRVTVRNSHHSADRQYYKYRNFVLLVRDGTAAVDREWVRRAGLALAWGPIKIAAFEDAKRPKIRAALAGVLDGWRGVSGPRSQGRRSVAVAQPRPGSVRPRVLYIGTPFFGYYRHIIAVFEKKGYEVDHFNDRPGENPFLKAVIRVRPRLVTTIVARYLRGILEQTRGRDYDVILVVNGKVLTPEFMQALRAEHPRARAVLYLWDALSLYPQVVPLAPFFDARFTFDALDASERSDFKLLPLFFTDDHRAVGASAASHPRYDLVNVCTAHPNRYAVMRDLIPRLRSEGLQVFSYLYLNPLQFVHGKVTAPEFKGAQRSEFAFSPLATGDYLSILSDAAAVLDINHAAQTGLTMRTIETMGARRKLVTTNTEVLKYPLYHPSRVLVLGDDHIDTDTIREFIETPQVPLDDATYEKFGLDAWVDEILAGDGSSHESVLDQ